MTHPARCCRVLVILLTVVLAAFLPARAEAQGRCSCNNGCHTYPGQCVQPASSGCDPGFAPFCSTRAESCPRAGWVSCSGECTCVRITPTDAGVPPMDVPSPPTDVASPSDRVAPGDLSMTTDVPMSMDAPPGGDGSATVDARSPTDAGASTTDGSPSPDAPSPADGAPRTDVHAPDDRSLPSSDASLVDVRALPSSDAMSVDGGGEPVSDASPANDRALPPADTAAVDGGRVPTTDGGCDCDGGLCAGGVCYREPCIYHPELGFICTTPGTACRLVGGETYCVPICAGVTCAAGQFCDERSNGACVVDRCASLTCPIGTTCFRNRCGRWGGPDGGIFLPDDLDASLGDGGMAAATATDAGCGCRVGSNVSSPRGGLLSAALVAWWMGRQRVRRRTTSAVDRPR